MTTGEVIAATGICPSTIYGHIERGNLYGTMVNGRWQFTPDEVYSWACFCWRCQTITMYPPHRIKDYIQTFCIRKERKYNG